jgi:hypothetical protein
VSVLGAWRNANGQQEIDELFTALGNNFSDCTSYAFELQQVVGTGTFSRAPIPDSPPSKDMRLSQDRTAWRDFDGGNPPCVQHQQSIAMSAAKQAGVLRQRSDDAINELGFVARFRLLVGDIEAVTADEADPKHNVCHVSAH